MRTIKDRTTAAATTALTAACRTRDDLAREEARLRREACLLDAAISELRAEARSKTASVA